MADQEHFRGITGPTPDVELHGPSSITPVRRDTGSTTGSDDYVPLPPGRYTLLINGNCPRCHHHHKAALVKVKVFNDRDRVSHVQCENGDCQQYWLAFGGGNSTRISLLSQCTETDPIEIEREKESRYELIQIVRSVTSVASLSNIPEFPSRQPSREPSVHNDASRSIAEDPTSVDNANPHPHEETRPQPVSVTYEVDSDHAFPGTTQPGAGTRRTKQLLTRLKRKIKDHLPPWKKPFHFKQLLRSQKGSPMTERRQGKLPATPSPTPRSPAMPQDSDSTKDMDIRCDYKPNVHEEEAGPSDPDKPDSEKHEAETRSRNPQPNVDKEELRNMAKEDRIAWLRKQFTKRRCRCPGNCHCRRSSRTFPVPVYERLHPPPLAPPLSEGLLGLVLPDDHFSPDDRFDYARSLSIGSTTIVGSEALTATSGGPRRSAHLLDIQRERHRSRSPRPQSYHARSRLRYWPDSADGRSSGESFGTGGAVRSPSTYSRRPTDGFSASAVGPTSMPAGYEAMVAEPAQGYVEIQPTPNPAPTPHLNGYRTSSERNRDSPSPA
ncbi:hypothetical protein P154DRAFT_577961 [Amniculicola lignicola CBS 123094]|uniref:Uncharacterized protein n=1 Tax=Amniculicola lignicola CBS 123094 TaxID=1392246 RepID=A0A6A5W8W9_9PLEO|nr:hypothetical protein P154DRAFT_577961 [Amniculicola lignicola CBS 123094]